MTETMAQERETYVNESDGIAHEVIERALPLSVFSPSVEGYSALYETMGIRHAVQHEHNINGATFYLQDDTIQESGAFKSRGAAHAVMSAAVETIYAATAGNHGSGIAQACQKLGKNAHIIAPRDAASVKVQRMEQLGAYVDTHSSGTVDEAVPAARALAEYSGGLFVHPYDNIDVIAGQATAGFDILKNLLAEHAVGKVNLFDDDIQIYVPIGGGGLIAGVASVFRWAKDSGYVGENVALVGVQMAGCDAAYRAVQHIRQGELPERLFGEGELNNRCDGTAVEKVGECTLPIIADTGYVSRIMLVSEAELGAGMYDLCGRLGKRIEPAGALGHAAALIDDTGQYKVPFCSGRNVTDETWRYFTESYQQCVTTLPSRVQAVASGLVIRKQLPVVADDASGALTLSEEAHTGIMDDYYRSLEDSGIYLIR